MAYQLDPVKFLSIRGLDPYGAPKTSTPAFTGATAKKYKNKDISSTEGFGSFGDISSNEAKKELYGGKFDEMGSDMNMLISMDNADTELGKAQEFKKYQEAMEAKQRAACKSSKKKGLFGSLITGGIGLATGNPQLIAAGATGAIGSMGSSC